MYDGAPAKAALERAIAAWSCTTRLEIPLSANLQAFAVPFHSRSPTKPAGGCRPPRSSTATPQQGYHADSMAIPFADAACLTASQVAFGAATSGIDSSA